MLKWHDDPYLRHYGVKIDPNMTTVSILIHVIFLVFLANKPRHKPVFSRLRRFNTTDRRPLPITPVVGTFVERSSSL
jgi:hypothetical protein